MEIYTKIEKYNVCLPTIISIPKTISINKIIVICYGFNGNRSEEHKLIINFTKKAVKCGYIIVRFDYYGHGISDGKYCETDILSKLDNIRMVIEYLEGCFRNDDIEITLLGISDGGRLATQIASENNKVKNIVCWNPLFELAECLNDNYFKILNRMKTINFCGMEISTKYYTQMLNLISVNVFLELNINKICFFGDKDKLTLDTQKKLIERDGPLDFIKNGNHLFNDVDSEKLIIDKTIKWLCGNKKNDYKRWNNNKQ